MSDGQVSAAPPSWAGELVRCANRLRVDLIVPSDPRYDNARLLYNRFHDLRPAALAQTSDANAIAEIVRFSADHGVALAIRGGGHHIAGYGSCEGGIVIDFSPYRKVSVDPATGCVAVDPGARLIDVDNELCPRGLVIPTGTISDTGIAGLTLGGGIGWLVGRYGLTCDQLIGADVILADGRQVKTEDPENIGLLWALRGGGGNFGVVTRFRYRANPLPPCTTGSGCVTLENAASALVRIVTFLETSCPRDLTTAATLTKRPDSKPMLSVDFCLTGSDERVLRDLSAAVGTARWSIHRNGDYRAWQRAFDSSFQPPMRGYWKARYGTSLTNADIEAIVNAFQCAPEIRASILIEHLHGAFTDTGIDTAAFPLRWARFGVLFSARWPDLEADTVALNWIHESFNRLDPAGLSAAYSNYAADGDPRALSSFQTSSTERLHLLKQVYDPRNLFRRNHNIRIGSRDPEHSEGTHLKS